MNLGTSRFASGVRKIRDRLYQLNQRINGYPSLKKLFYSRNGYALDLRNPITHNQRIVHKMVTNRDPLMVLTADKVRVRDYVGDKLGHEVAEQILIPVYHISKNGKDIPFDRIKDEFFMKANHSSGANRLVKPGDDRNELIKLCRQWLSTSYGQFQFEWAYRDIPRRIICEKVIRDSNGQLANDIKFYCFHGKVRLILFLSDRFTGNPKRLFTDEHLNEIPGAQMLKKKKPKSLPGIVNFGWMKELSEKLAKPFTYCRIDLYQVDGKTYFGEITHYTGAGLDYFDDLKTDQTFGELWKSKNKHKSFFDLYKKQEISVA
ncbi:ATP-grasp fold amidoligase family protein [Algoriphagus sediminis]|uniref:ATP-grasp fold amidoligase family protein n=1 Tax=Algoriphagus sediminis TaxID=3057113 RepID=A0ABT7YE05_9BACT|nr:ATP-grasp fold amidoligase family protein [Algoriphagus sediminis]MDN3204717.1 ATP-grasp fold amidoligase family protein [Algoriphagus sediminis]